MDLIRAGHDLEYTARNRKNKKYQIYAFEDSVELRKIIARINNQNYKGYLKGNETDLKKASIREITNDIVIPVGHNSDGDICYDLVGRFVS
ncbi:hypothetical protein [Bacillus cereus]|uniref:Uncharacterized protein n=1 Tax=Bacillus cereus (strain VD014) TaxID=1053223 RepID=A0A9W5NMC3_BACC8|nr:hypothetical protein [Bacillus cereus]EJR12433.1 hypothetical protein IIA_05626 [Bacillus cereus VD014]